MPPLPSCQQEHGSHSVQAELSLLPARPAPASAAASCPLPRPPSHPGCRRRLDAHRRRDHHHAVDQRPDQHAAHTEGPAAGEARGPRPEGRRSTLCRPAGLTKPRWDGDGDGDGVGVRCAACSALPGQHRLTPPPCPAAACLQPSLASVVVPMALMTRWAPEIAGPAAGAAQQAAGGSSGQLQLPGSTEQQMHQRNLLSSAPAAAAPAALSPPAAASALLQAAALPAAAGAVLPPQPRNRGSLVLAVGVGALLAVPVFRQLTGLPPFLGMLSGLGVMWLTTDALHFGEDRRYPTVSQVGPGAVALGMPGGLHHRPRAFCCSCSCSRTTATAPHKPNQPQTPAATPTPPPPPPPPRHRPPRRSRRWTWRV
jgi:hypothetical protein